MEWLKESWGYLVSWGATLAAVLYAVRVVYAAERDRRALKQVDLEREKLSLEVARLHKDPTIVADRRAIYDRLRGIVAAITKDADVSVSQIAVLHEIRHDAEYRFPGMIVASIRALIDAVVALHVSGTVLKEGPARLSSEDWQKHVTGNDAALREITEFEQGLVDMFRPYLSL